MPRCALRARKGFLLHAMGCWPRKMFTEEESVEWQRHRAAEIYRTFSPKRRLASVTIFVLFSLYPTLIQSAVSVLRCTDSIDGVRYLAEDLSKECFTVEHSFFFSAGIGGTVIYAVGIPLCAFALIYHNRDLIAANDPDATGALGFLFAGYSTKRGGFVMSWEVFVMARKLCIVVLGIVELSGTIQVLCAILLLVISLVVTINVRPYETQWMNLLEEGTLLVLILTQTLSLVYLDIDTQAASAGERVDHEKEVMVTIFLAILNSCALIVLTLALVVSALREYGPKVGICKKRGVCDRCAANVLDERWVKSMVMSSEIELKWQGQDGAFADTPQGVVVGWKEIATGNVSAADISIKGQIIAPPLGHELSFSDQAGAVFALGPITAVWVTIGADQEVVELTPELRSRYQWKNSRTGIVTFVDPTDALSDAAMPGGQQQAVAGAAAAAAAAAAVAAAAAAAGVVVAGAPAVGGGGGGGAGIVVAAPADDVEADAPAAVGGGGAAAAAAAAAAADDVAGDALAVGGGGGGGGGEAAAAAVEGDAAAGEAAEASDETGAAAHGDAAVAAPAARSQPARRGPTSSLNVAPPGSATNLLSHSFTNSRPFTRSRNFGRPPGTTTSTERLNPLRVRAELEMRSPNPDNGEEEEEDLVVHL
jgi:hypothetical protein